MLYYLQIVEVTAWQLQGLAKHAQVYAQRKESDMAKVCSENAKEKQICRPQVTADDVPSGFLRHYPAYKRGQLNVSELARVCNISRTTAYKYINLLES